MCIVYFSIKANFAWYLADDRQENKIVHLIRNACAELQL